METNPNTFIHDARHRMERTLADEVDVIAAYLLGSGARGALRPDSDLDVAILSMPGVRWDAARLAALALELTLAANREVDLGLLHSANLIYARQAILLGDRFYCRDRTRSDLAAATLLGMAADLNFTRSEVLDAYVA